MLWLHTFYLWYIFLQAKHHLLWWAIFASPPKVMRQVLLAARKVIIYIIQRFIFYLNLSMYEWKQQVLYTVTIFAQAINMFLLKPLNKIWVVQDHPSQQEWPCCFTDDRKRYQKTSSNFYLPSLQLYVSSQWEFRISDWGSAPHCNHQKPIFLYPSQGSDVFLSLQVHLVKFCTLNLRVNITNKKVYYNQQLGLINRIYCNRRKTEMLWSTGSTGKTRS